MSLATTWFGNTTLTVLSQTYAYGQPSYPAWAVKDECIYTFHGCCADYDIEVIPYRATNKIYYNSMCVVIVLHRKHA